MKTQTVPPPWLQHLIDDVVAPSMCAHSWMAELAYQWWDETNPSNDFDGWQVAVYPAPVELCGSDPLDGSTVVSGFSLDVQSVMNAFAQVEGVEWHASTLTHADLDGPCVSVKGVFDGVRVLLRLFQVPPRNEPVRFRLDRARRIAWSSDERRPTDKH